MNTNHGRTPPPYRPAHTWVDTSPNDDTHYSTRFSSDELNVLSTNELLGTPGGTVQSYREVIDKLRIDNSNLKLKLFFMENVVSETTEKLNGAHHPGLAEKDRENFLHEVRLHPYPCTDGFCKPVANGRVLIIINLLTSVT